DGPGDISGDGAFTGGPFTSHGEAVSVSYDANTDTYTGSAGGRDVFKLVIEPNGSYTFTLMDTLDHPDPNDHNDSVQMKFGFKATDADGDVSNGQITVNVFDDGPTAN